MESDEKKTFSDCLNNAMQMYSGAAAPNLATKVSKSLT
jgi:hypothetical protein